MMLFTGTQFYDIHQQFKHYAKNANVVSIIYTLQKNIPEEKITVDHQSNRLTDTYHHC